MFVFSLNKKNLFKNSHVGSMPFTDECPPICKINTYDKSAMTYLKTTVFCRQALALSGYAKDMYILKRF